MGLTTDTDGPDGADVSVVGAETLPVVGVPDVDDVVFGGGEEKIAVRVEDYLCERALVALQEDRALKVRGNVKEGVPLFVCGGDESLDNYYQENFGKLKFDGGKQADWRAGVALA
jgi:hypothetical protein